MSKNYGLSQLLKYYSECLLSFFFTVLSLNVIDSQLGVFETSFTLNTSANINIGILISEV